jgi:hypothetical protein
MYGKDYMSNSISLINDANEIRTEIMKTSKTNIETLRNLRRSVTFKNIRDWFYQKEQETDSLGDEEFDPGFDTQPDDEQPSSQPLGAEDMDRISGRQISTMYQIASHQNESMMASTAEIITTINQRNSEILASVNNINSTLIGISKKLDAFANVYTAKTEREVREGLYDSDGTLSLQRIFNASRGQGLMGFLPDLLSIAPTFFEGGPTPLIKSLLEMTVGSKPREFLGGESINNALDTLNDRIGEGIQSGLESLITNKTFKTLFGDLLAGERNKDWNAAVVNGYNDKAAPFDGYVRTTIIQTIPEYLRIIAKGVTGVNYNVDKFGSLSMGSTTLSKDELNAWKRDERRNADKYRGENWGKLNNENFNVGGLSFGVMQDLYATKPTDISDFDVDQIQRTLIAVYVQYLNQIGQTGITRQQLRQMDSAVINMATEIMSKGSKKKNINWFVAVSAVLQRIATGPACGQFVGAINNAYKEDQERRTNFVSTSSPLASTADVVTNKDTIKSGIRNIRDAYKDEATTEKIRELEAKLRELTSGNDHSLRGLFTRGQNILDADKRNEINNIQEQLKQLQASQEARRTRGHGNTYNQQSYGNFLGIAQNGCGPVALADMLARRGIYDPMKGMSADDFINASGLLGQPLVAGKVNNMTLRSASATNPITVLGSGAAFGTAEGNNHFMNVVGTDGHGNVYVSNPIDGKIHKRSINEVGSSSLLGLYGSGRIGNAIHSFISSSTDQMMDSAKNKIHETSARIADQSDGFIDKSLRGSLDKAVAIGNGENISEEDKAQMSLVLSLMESALEDGDGSSDKQAIMMEISRIKDQKLKARLRASVSGMLERSEKKKSGSGLLGRLLSGGKGMLKNLFAPLLAGISVIITKVITKAKAFIKPVFNFIKQRITKHAIGTIEGVKSIGSGIVDVASVTTTVAKEVGTLIKNIAVIARDKIESIAKGAAKWLKGKFEKFKETKIGSTIIGLADLTGRFVMTKLKDAVGWFKHTFKGVTKFLKGAAEKISKWWNNGEFFKNITNKFRNTAFGAGFMSSFDKANARIKAKEEAQNPGLKEQRQVLDAITGNTPSLLKDMKEDLDQILKQYERKGKSGETTVAQETTDDGKRVIKPGVADGSWGGESTQTVISPTASANDTSWNAPPRPNEQTEVAFNQFIEAQHESDRKQEENTTQIVNAVDEMKNETVRGNQEEANRDKAQQTQDVRQHQELTHVVEANVNNNEAAMESAEDENRIVTTSMDEADGKKKGPSLVDKLLGGMGKMFGGALGAIMNISQMIMEIVMGMSGVKAIMKLIKTTLSEILKPLNSVAKELFKTMKPVLDILKGSLQELVSAVTGPICEILKSLSPLLELVAGAVNGILKFITPVINLIAKGIGKIVGFVSGIITKIFGKFQKLIHKLTPAIAFLAHPLSKKKRREYLTRMGYSADNGSDEEDRAKAKRASAEAKADPKRAKEARAIADEAYFSDSKSDELYNKIMTGEVSPEEARAIAKYNKTRKRMILDYIFNPLVAFGNDMMGNYDAGKKANKPGAKKSKDGKTSAVVEMTQLEKEREALRLSKLIYPSDPTKATDIYEKIMTGSMTLEDAESLSKVKVLNKSSVNVNGIEAESDSDKLIKYLDKRYEHEDAVKKADDEKADKNRDEDVKMQKAIYKHGILEMVSNIHSLSDAGTFLKGVLTTSQGTLQGGIGGIVSAIGKVIVAIGHGFALLPFVDENNKIAMIGQSMLEKADKLISDGDSTTEKGLNMMMNQRLDIGSSFMSSLKDAVSTTADAATSAISKQSYYRTTDGGYSIPGRTSYTTGDIPMSNIDKDTQSYIIGTGDAQQSFGNYLNMARRGCGPVALADAYNRRTGRNVNPRSLASKMISHGTYDPTRGTSVSGYMAASNALGMNTQVGGVSMASLKHATPNNPITLVGSGGPFGTRTGNNHYLNAVGTDKYGGVYVSNPMTGKVQRRSANDIAGHSLLGIYGSGDNPLELDTFSDATKEAISNLASISTMFTDLFKSDGASDIETMSKEKKKEDEAAKIANTAQEEYSKDDYQTKVMTAMDLYRVDNPIRDNETQEEYEKRISDEWNGKSTIRNKYIAMVVSDSINEDLQNRYNTMIANSKGYYEPYVVYKRDAAGNIVHDEAGNPIVSGGFKYLVESDDSEYVKSRKASIAIKKLGEVLTAAVSAGGRGGSGGGGGGAARSGGGTGNTSDLYEAAAQVWEAAGNKLGATYAYDNRGPITTRSGVTLDELHPDCSGMISAAMNYMGYTFKGTMNGSNRRWTTHDITGKTSNDLIYNSDGSLSSDWEFIPYAPSKLRPGDILTTPSHVGLYIRGDQPNAYGYDAGNGVRLPQLAKGAAKAYLDRNSSWQDYLEWTMGPGYSGDGGTPTTILRYIGGTNGSSMDSGDPSGNGSGGTSASIGSHQGRIKLSQAMQAAPVFWSPYPAKLTAGGYWDAAKKAGLTAAQTAMIAAIGIHEDAAKKLTGEKSLTAVTFDKNGQAAFGLMNWIPDAKNAHRGGHETKYGSTLADQLPYIKQKYFDANSTFDRAKNVNFNDYKSGITSALGHAPKLGKNDRWGPFAEQDVAEAMGHYVANALVPENWSTSAQLAKHMRTAADAYNWMMDNGQTGYSTGGGGSTVVSGGGSSLNLTELLGDWAQYLPDGYYSNLLGSVQTSLDNAAATTYYDSGSSDYGDYSYDGDEEVEQGDAEAEDYDTRVYATTSEVKKLYSTMTGKYGGTAWSNSQLLSKGRGTITLYLDHSDSSKISCTLQNNKTYAKVTTWGSWVFVFAGARSTDGRPYCGWGHASDFTNVNDAINKKNDKTYKTTTVNPANSAADARALKWKGSSDSMMFYNPGDLQADADKKFWSADKRNHWYNSKSGVQTDIKKYWKYEVKNSKRTKVADPYVMLNTSYDKSHVNVYQPFLLSKLKSKTLKQLNADPTACGDFDYNVPDSGVFVPDGIYGSGDVTTVANNIPPIDTGLLDKMLGNRDLESSYTVNNYTIQGGINNDTADLSRSELLNYLIKTEFTTRSPRTEKILNKILAKLDSINPTSNNVTPDASQMYDDAIPEVISNLIRG